MIPVADTSLDAYNVIKPHLNALHEKILAEITAAGARGRTSWELIQALGMFDHTVRARIAELRWANLVCHSGEKRRNGRGRFEVVYVLVSA